MINVAEAIFVRMAEAMFQNKITVRNAFKDHSFVAEMEGHSFELISPMGFLEGIKELGIENLKEIEVTYLLKVLSKNEFDGAILM